MDMKKPNKNKQLRLSDEDAARILRLVSISGLSESDVLRMALRTGLPMLERGEVNIFLPETPELKMVEEDPVVYKKPSTKLKAKE
jgi:hypothetical protein